MKQAVSFLVFLLLVACVKDDPIVTDIMLDTTTLELKVGETHQFKATHTPPEAPTPTYSWEVSQNFSVIDGSNYFNGDIDQTGLFTAKIVGSTFVTVRTKDAINPLTGKPFEVSCQVKVLPINVESLSLNHTSLTMSVGDTVRLICTVFPENATEQRVSWTNNHNDIVDYQIQTDGSCIIQAKKKGEATIKAISKDRQTEVVCKIVVDKAPLTSIAFEEKEYQVEIGGTKQLTVVYTPDFADNKNVKWSSSDSHVATVDEKGLITANAKGSAKITAVSEDGNHKASCTIHVVDIDQLMEISVPSGGMVIINGYYTGVMSCKIQNNSSKTVKLTRYRIVESVSNKIIAQTEDPAFLGEELKPCESVALSVKLNSVYLPVHIWSFEYQGQEYTVSKDHTFFGNSKADNPGNISSMSDQPMAPVTRAKE